LIEVLADVPLTGDAPDSGALPPPTGIISMSRMYRARGLPEDDRGPGGGRHPLRGGQDAPLGAPPADGRVVTIAAKGVTQRRKGPQRRREEAGSEEAPEKGGGIPQNRINSSILN